METARKQEFVNNEIFAATLGATVQRSKTYSDNATSAEKEDFKKTLRKQLEDFTQSYKSEVSEEQHVLNIVALAKSLSEKHSPALYCGKFRIGSAQKALNLYLKYQWCLGNIECRPPHCPIDSIVLSKLPGRASTKWTELDDIAEYEKIITEAKTKAGGIPLSVWELQVWEERNV